MQKLINVIALLSGLTSAALIGGSAYVLLNKDVLIEDVRAKVTETVTNTVKEALPGMLEGKLPKLPKVTGPVVPETTGLPIP